MPKIQELEQLGDLIDQALQKAILLNETTMIYLLSMLNLEILQALDRMSPETQSQSTGPHDTD